VLERAAFQKAASIHGPFTFAPSMQTRWLDRFLGYGRKLLERGVPVVNGGASAKGGACFRWPQWMIDGAPDDPRRV